MNEFRDDSLPSAARDFQPEWGLVLGSGLGAFVDTVAPILTLKYGDIPGLRESSVAGHSGRFVFAEIGGKRAVVASGRVHLYEGHSAREVTASIRWMAALGISKLVLTNAAGTLNPDFPPGSWMMIEDHLNLTGTSPLLGGAHFIDMSEVYAKTLRERFSIVATEENFALHNGVYAGVTGPQYETPAEVRMFRRLGADAVGMSTVLEAIQARALGLEVAAFSCLTNWAAGLGGGNLNHAEVIEGANTNGQRFARLLQKTLAAP